MLSAVLIDWQHQHQVLRKLRCFGMVVILLGMYPSRIDNASRDKLKSSSYRQFTGTRQQATEESLIQSSRDNHAKNN